MTEANLKKLIKDLQAFYKSELNAASGRIAHLESELLSLRSSVDRNSKIKEKLARTKRELVALGRLKK